jgi:hypothetical protein
VLSVIFSLMIPPVATLMVVALLNAIGRLVFRRWLLETPDLVVIFTILFVGTAMAAEWMNVCVPLWHSFGLYAENSETYRNRVICRTWCSWLFHTTDAEPIREYGIGGYKFPYALTKLGVWLADFSGLDGAVWLRGAGDAVHQYADAPLVDAARATGVPDYPSAHAVVPTAVPAVAQSLPVGRVRGDLLPSTSSTGCMCSSRGSRASMCDSSPR